MTKQKTSGKQAPRPYFRKHAVPDALAHSGYTRFATRSVAILAVVALIITAVAPMTFAAQNNAAVGPATLPSSVQLYQWETVPAGNWITGDLGTNNSNYSEGEVVPFKLDIDVNQVNVGDQYQFSVCRNYSNGTRRGYLFLAPYNTSRTANAGGTITSTSGAFSGVGVTINSVNEVGGQGACSAGDRETIVNVTRTSATVANVLWGGHLAAPSDAGVGAGNGASSYPGGSLHMSMMSPSKDRSIKTAAIIPENPNPTLTLVKSVINDNNGTAAATDWTLSATGPTSISGSTGDTSVTSAVVTAGTYTLAESGGPSGYTSLGWSCTNGITVTNSQITLTSTSNTTCTITNDDNAPTTGNVTVTKVVVNDNGGTKVVSDFVLSVGNTTVTSGATNAFAAGTYTVSESGPAGYAGTFSGDCNAQTHQITVVAGHDYNCTITNDDIQPLLTVTKVVVNDDGGQLQVADFPLFVGNVSVTSGAQNGFNASTTAYVVSETGDPGYAGTISGDCDLQGNIILSVGDVKSCTITNNDIPAIPQTGTITVTKIVDNTGGGTKLVSDFPLFVNTTSVTSGIKTTFNTGSYVVSETGDANYSAAFSGDCDAKTGAITLAVDQDLTCTITNTFIIPPPTDFDVSVVKSVSDSSPSVGDTITYTLVAANSGPASATGNVLTDVIPTGLSYVSDDGGADTTYDAGTHTLTWTVGTLASGASVTLHVDASVNAGQEGQGISNTGSIPVAQGDTNADNNSSTVRLTVNTPSGGCTSNCGGGGGGGGGTPVSNVLSGFKYNDLNKNGARDIGESGLSGWVIYLDLNNNNVRDSGEPFQTTDATGFYSFNNIAPGTYTVREESQTGWTQFEPGVSAGDERTVVITNTSSITNSNFGNAQGQVLGDVTTTPSITPTPPNPRVLGEELPRTGMSVTWMILIGSIAAYAAVSATRKPTISKK